MNSNEFVFWLEGFLENKDNLSEKEIEILIKKSKEISKNSITLAPDLRPRKTSWPNTYSDIIL